MEIWICHWKRFFPAKKHCCGPIVNRLFLNGQRLVKKLTDKTSTERGGLWTLPLGTCSDVISWHTSGKYILTHPEVSQPNLIQIGNAAANLFISTAIGFILVLSSFWYRDRYFLGMCTHERTSAIEGSVISFMHYLAYTWFMQAKFRPKGQK